MTDKIMQKYEAVEEALLQFCKELETIEREGSLSIPQECFELLSYMAEYNERIVVLIGKEEE
jgi:hypothetical protein